MKTTNTSNSGSAMRIVQRKKLWFILPAAVALLTAIMLTVFAFVANSPVNVGVDIAGGYFITVKSSAFNEDNYSEYVEKLENIAADLVDENGDSYGLRISNARRIGVSVNTTIYLNYKRIKGFSSEEMTTLGKDFEQAIKDNLARVVPTVKLSGEEARIVYDRTMAAYVNNIQTQILDKYPGATLEWVNPAPAIGEGSTSTQPYATELKFTNAATLNATEADIESAATIDDAFSLLVSEADVVSGSISPDLINYAAAAAAIAVMVAFIYFIIRFKSLSVAFSVSLGLILDIVMLLCFMMMFHIEITGMIIAAVVMTMLFSVYNKAMVFVRIKENMRGGKFGSDTTALIDNSVCEVLKRNIFMLVALGALFVAITVACAIACVFSIVYFALPVLIGLVSSSFTTLFFCPSMYSVLAKATRKPKEKVKVRKKEQVTI